MKIMLVDDNDISNFILRKFLEKAGLHSEIIEFTDPQEAFENVESFSPDLLFLDLQMPHLNGWQFLEGLENKGLMINTVILTSSNSQKDKSRAAGFKDVIFFAEKPMEENQMQELLSVLDKMEIAD